MTTPAPIPARHLQRLAAWLRNYVGRAPGTHIYLLVVLVTTATIRSASPELSDQLLRQVSTNLYQMGRSAGRVLLLSAFLLDGGSWLMEAALLSVVFVPLERWVGTARWLAIAAAGHVGATLVTTFGIWADVRHNRGGASLVRTIDVGVSYGRMAAAGFLVFAFRPGRWRALYVVVLGALVGWPLVSNHSFTDAGHAAAACIGAAMWLVFGPGLHERRLNPPWAGWVHRSQRSRTAP